MPAETDVVEIKFGALKCDNRHLFLLSFLVLIFIFCMCFIQNTTGMMQMVPMRTVLNGAVFGFATSLTDRVAEHIETLVSV